MKLCKDCKWFVPDTLGWDHPTYQEKYAICGLTSKVDGRDGSLCRDRRRGWGFVMACGPDGKQWEEK